LDPHDITKGIFFSHCGWLLKKKSKALLDEGKKINMDDLNED
jgi:stearoyl-CoA desaturase (delta-9 desaturase)